ncbi:MAG: hypothetical protein P1P76_06765 [Anaerolineales bacterium]|nr:hypothetical protein [Anaerolineales bacterium]
MKGFLQAPSFAHPASGALAEGHRLLGRGPAGGVIFGGIRASLKSLI